jgi:hypothetical protein
MFCLGNTEKISGDGFCDDLYFRGSCDVDIEASIRILYDSEPLDPSEGEFQHSTF